MTVGDVYDYINSFAPFDTQCKWDNSGLAIGSMTDKTDSIMLSLDVTNDVIEQAKANDCHLIVSHHPIIFNPIKNIEQNSPVYNAIKCGISILSAHTNLDMADGGVCDTLANTLEIKNIEKAYADGEPILRVGTADYDNAADFAHYISKKLGNAVKFTDSGRKIEKVALCCGAGGEYIKDVYDMGCDCFVTGEAKHHEFFEAENLGISLFAAGHFATENPAIDLLHDKFTRKFKGHSIFRAYQNCPYKTVI